MSLSREKILKACRSHERAGREAISPRVSKALADARERLRRFVSDAQRVYPEYRPGSIVDETAAFALLGERFNMSPSEVATMPLPEVFGLVDAFLYTPQPGQKLERPGKLGWLATAMLLVKDNPEWSDAKIAKAVNRHASQLSRSAEYQNLAAMARENCRTRRGHVVTDENGLRDVEAYDEDANFEG